MKISFLLNGETVLTEASSDETLLSLLRKGQTLSVRRGCENGECGTCTVLFNGKTVNACLLPAVRANGGQVTTLEGLSDDPTMRCLQEAFVRHGALQCGFCGSGMLLSAFSIVKSRPDPSREEIREGIAGNLCRCSGYIKIEEAILDAAGRLRGEKRNG